jgi:hypothetical protein
MSKRTYVQSDGTEVQVDPYEAAVLRGKGVTLKVKTAPKAEPKVETEVKEKTETTTKGTSRGGRSKQ